MAELFVLLYGKSKKQAHPIMVNTFDKCDKYRMSRENSGVVGWHAIKHAKPGAKTWRQKSATRGGNKCESVARVNLEHLPGSGDGSGDYFVQLMVMWINMGFTLTPKNKKTSP